MNNSKVRVRFAPSPTGPLHIGGVRTALYNFLYAKKMNGIFIIRIEDTDQNRYVEGAEEYILSSLAWLGLNPDEGPSVGGAYGPYRQSERKDIYAKYAEELVQKGHAYYAFDTAAELEAMRESNPENGGSNKYDAETRGSMRNSISLSGEALEYEMKNSENKVIRLKIPRGETISFTDMVREEVSFQSDLLDDKVILKADGMPTYHLANIIDDHLMEISHVIRGEEWLSSTAHHILMYRFFGWEAPVFTHLPLLLKPSGKGKLSKRDGAKFGFPVFPMQWDGGEEVYTGFKEEGFDVDALINFLALLGWHPSDDREIMNIDEMAQAFSLESIVKSGARFDIEKANWFNQQYIMHHDSKLILARLKDFLPQQLTDNFGENYILEVIELMKQRISNYKAFYKDTIYLFESPEHYDEANVKKRFSSEVGDELKSIGQLIYAASDYTSENLNALVKQYLNDKALKMGVYLPLIRIMICGSMTGPDLFDMLSLLGKETVHQRWQKALDKFKAML